MVRVSNILALKRRTDMKIQRCQHHCELNGDLGRLGQLWVHVVPWLQEPPTLWVECDDVIQRQLFENCSTCEGGQQEEGRYWQRRGFEVDNVSRDQEPCCSPLKIKLAVFDRGEYRGFVPADLTEEALILGHAQNGVLENRLLQALPSGCGGPGTCGRPVRQSPRPV